MCMLWSSTQLELSKFQRSTLLKNILNITLMLADI